MPGVCDQGLKEFRMIRQEEANGTEHLPCPRRYIIDLSRPPRQRYQHLVTDFKDEIKTLPALFDELVRENLPNASDRTVLFVRRVAKCLLRGVKSKEENEELRGIHEATGIEMWLLVAFNVLLDLFMGCTSGGVRIRDDQNNTKMVHFRTLDWGMPALRKVVVILDYVENPDGPVIASSITYAGYVGVLTGVRENISMSLNFRPTHDKSTRLANVRFYLHHILVLLGFRLSVSSLLRQCLLPTAQRNSVQSKKMDLRAIEDKVPSMQSTAAYLIFCDGERTITMEKDRKTAVVRSANDFIVTTNHDVADEQPAQNNEAKENTARVPTQTLKATGMEVLIEESTERKGCIVEKWMAATARKRRQGSAASITPVASVKKETVIKWLSAYPTTNEETHYSTIMDPTTGTICWSAWYSDPLEIPDSKN